MLLESCTLLKSLVVARQCSSLSVLHDAPFLYVVYGRGSDNRLVLPRHTTRFARTFTGLKLASGFSPSGVCFMVAHKPTLGFYGGITFVFDELVTDWMGRFEEEVHTMPIYRKLFLVCHFMCLYLISFL